MAHIDDTDLKKARDAREMAQQFANRCREDLTAASAEVRPFLSARALEVISELDAAENRLADARASVESDARWSDWGPGGAVLQQEEDAVKRRDEVQIMLDNLLAEEGASVQVLALVLKEKEARWNLFSALARVVDRQVDVTVFERLLS